MTSWVCFHFNPVWEISILENLKNAAIIIINVNAISVISCFSCFAFLGSSMLQVLVDDIVYTRKLDIRTRMKIIEAKIKKWKLYYRLLVDYLDAINQCFGLALLCYTLKIFVISISKTFSFLITKAPDEFLADFRFVATHSLSFCNLVFNCHRIQTKVNSPILSIKDFHLPNI